MLPSTTVPALLTVTHAFGMWKFAALLVLVFAALFVAMVLIGNQRDKRRHRTDPRAPSEE